MVSSISLIRVRIESVEEFREKIISIKNEYKNIERFQLCLRSSLLNERLANEITAVGAIGARNMLRLEVDEEIAPDILEKIKPVICLIVFIAGKKDCISRMEESCRTLKIDYRNFLQDRNNIPSNECIVKERTKACLTEKKLIEAMGGASGLKQVETEKLDDTQEVVLIPIGAGLACQIFLYVFAVKIAQMTHRKIILDDSGNYIRNSLAGKEKFVDELMWNYHIDEKEAVKCAEEAYKVISHFQFEGLELGYIFDLKLPLLSGYFSHDDWSAYIDWSCGQKFSQTPEILEKMGYSVSLIRDNVGIKYQNNLISMLYETSFINIYLNDSEDYNKMKWLLDENCHNAYLSVLATSGDIKDSLFTKGEWIQSIMRFPALEDAENKKICEEIQKCYSVIIHVRRGEKIYSDWMLDSGYYKAAISEIEKMRRDGIKYFLFSDSMEWCRENEEELGLNIIKDRLIYVEGNSGRNSYKDLQLMAEGRIMIPSPASGFSVCAMLFGKFAKCVDKNIFLERKEIKIVEINEE